MHLTQMRDTLKSYHHLGVWEGKVRPPKRLWPYTAIIYSAVFYLVGAFAIAPGCTGRSLIRDTDITLIKMAGQVQELPSRCDHHAAANGKCFDNLIGAQGIGGSNKEVVFARRQDSFRCSQGHRLESCVCTYPSLNLISGMDFYRWRLPEISVVNGYSYAVWIPSLTINIRSFIGSISNPDVWALVLCEGFFSITELIPEHPKSSKRDYAKKPSEPY